MAEPVFSQSGANTLYLLNYDGTTVNTAAFLPATATGVQITLSASWEENGTYLFLGEAVADITNFQQQISNFLQQQPGTLRFLWIQNPNASVTSWQYYTLNVSNNATYSVSLFTFGSYTLSVGGTCAINLQDDGTNYWFAITQPAGQQFFFLETQSGQYNYPLNGNTVNITFQQNLQGSLQFQLAVGGPENADFDTLDIGLRYYIDDLLYADALKSLRYQVFDNPTSTFTLNGNFDPVNQLLSSNTFLSFQGGAPATTFNSFYRTNLGQIITLAPSANAGFVFATLPQYKDDSTLAFYTLVPQGAFTIGLPQSTAAGPSTTPVARMMLGISGVEYAGLLIAAGNELNFYPDQPSYATSLITTSELKDTMTANTQDEPLSAIGTTSWVFITPPAGNNVNYYAQPDSSALYESDSAQSTDYFSFMETLAGVFVNAPPETVMSGNTMGFPAVPYSGISVADTSDYHDLELQVISPTRRARIKKLMQPPVISKTGDVFGVTPQGLKVGLDTTKTFWKSLTVAHTSQQSAAGQAPQQLQFTNITGNFKAAMQSNQLFMVAGSSSVFLDSGSTNFMLTRRAMAELLAAAVPSTVLCNARKDPSMEGKFYIDIDSFDTDLKQKLGDQDFETYKAIFHTYASSTSLTIGEEEYYDLSNDDVTALNTTCDANWSVPATILSQLSPAVVGNKYATIDEFTRAATTAIGAPNWQAYGYVLLEYARVVTNGWYFNLSPYQWDWSDNFPTLLIFKYSGKTLLEMAADTNTWAWPEVAPTKGGTLQKTQQILLSVLNNAITEQGNGVNEFDNFVQAITDPQWNGILALNCPMALDALPQELQGLAAGIDPAKFYGHHLGINITSVYNNKGVPELKESSLFGLIYYNDPGDQYNEGVPYAFKVLNLSVLFKNSVVIDFFSKVELMLKYLESPV